MSETPKPDFDIAKLGGWLEAHVAGFHGLAAINKFPGGQSNPTYKLEAASGSYVLRKKPSGTLLKSAHAIDREYRVMKALADTDVPVPKMLAICEDESVIGTSFFLMDFLQGRIFWDPALPDLTNADRAAIYDQMNRKLAALHSVGINKAGLADFGRPGDYFGRQLARWSDQYRASETGTIADMDALILWLNANLPTDDGRVSLVHGDYRIDNMMFDAKTPRMIALLDWELSTLGHPFADLAYQCMQWRLPNQGKMRGLAGLDRAALGLPTEADYVALYCQRTGIPEIANWNFYLAFSFFRLAAIIQGVKKRALDGNASDPSAGLRLGEVVPILAGMAIKTIQGGSQS